MSRFFGLRPSGQRLLAASALGGGVAAYSFILEPSGLSIFLCGLGAVLAAAALFGVPVQTASTGCFAAAYLTSLFSAGVDPDPGAPLIGLLLFGLFETLHHDGTLPESVTPDARRTRIWALAGTGLAGFAFASLLLVVASSVQMSGPGSVAAGGLVAVLLIGAIVGATRPLLADVDPERQDR